MKSKVHSHSLHSPFANQQREQRSAQGSSQLPHAGADAVVERQVLLRVEKRRQHVRRRPRTAGGEEKGQVIDGEKHEAQSAAHVEGSRADQEERGEHEEALG